MKTSLLTAALALACAACSGSAGGGGTTPDPRHRIFVTSTTYNGNLGGLAGADARCNAVAAAAGIAGDFVAVLSSSTEDASARTLVAGEVYVVANSGEATVATSGFSFWNLPLSNAINIDENQTTLAVMAEPWTGTNPGGGTSGIGLTCQDWTDGSAGNLGSTGDTSATIAAGWVNANGFLCNSVRPLYCIELQP